MTTHIEYGIDVSSNNGTINWSKVATARINNQKITDVRIKATEGISFVDPHLTSNIDGAKSIGARCGVYHFGHPSNNAIDEATHFYNTIKPHLSQINGIIVLDIEVTDNLDKHPEFMPSIIDNWATQFLDEIHRLTGREVIVYSSEWFAGQYLTNTLKKYPNPWIAKYGSTPPSMKYSAWQYTQFARVDGIETNVDLNEVIVLTQTVNYDKFSVAVGDKIFSAFVDHGSTYVLWTALNVYNEPHEYKGNGLFNINGVDVQGIVYESNTYLPWTALAKGIQAHKVEWSFSKTTYING